MIMLILNRPSIVGSLTIYTCFKKTLLKRDQVPYYLLYNIITI